MPTKYLPISEMVKQYGSDVMKIEPDIFLSKKKNIDKWLSSSEKSLASIKDSRIDEMHKLLKEKHQEILDMISTVEVEKRSETDKVQALRQVEYDRLLKASNFYTTKSIGGQQRQDGKPFSYFTLLSRESGISEYYYTTDVSQMSGKSFDILYEILSTPTGQDQFNREIRVETINTAIYVSLFEQKSSAKSYYADKALLTDGVPFIDKGKFVQVEDAKVAMKIVKLLEKIKKVEKYNYEHFMKVIDLSDSSESNVKDLLTNMKLLS